MSSKPALSQMRLRPPTASNLLIAGFAAVAIYDLMLGGALSASARIIPALVWRGGWERLLGAVFLHADALHLVLNAAALMVLGAAAEKVYGRLRIVLVFVLSAMGAGLVSVVLRPDDAVLTASGGSAGIAGLLAGLITFRTGALPEPIENRVRVAVAGMITVFAGMSFVIDDANVTMHLGGFLTGLLLSTALETELPSAPRPALAGGAAVLLMGAAIALVFADGAQRAEATLVGMSLAAEELERDGRKREAIELLEGALERHWEGSADRMILPFAQNQLAWYYVATLKNVDRGIDLSLESNNRLPDQPAFLDTLGYLYALSGRCREAGDAMSRAASLDAAYEARRVEVVRACAVGERPDAEIEVVAPKPTPSPLPRGPIGA